MALDFSRRTADFAAVRRTATRARPTMTSLIAVSSYTDTDILAHTPKGAENDQGIT